MAIRIGIYGYGNLGRGVETAVAQNNDMELCAVFTRRDPAAVATVSGAVPVYSAPEAPAMADKIDVMIMCGGSASDLPVQTPEMSRYFNVVDSFDTHAEIPRHFDNVDKSALETKHSALISAGWDPGLFSLMRLLSGSVLPKGSAYTFWGRGVSQGHSDAIRRIDGVLDARQYTVPLESALDAVRSGAQPELTTRQKHIRECFVVAEEGADKERIKQEIVNMPNYFADYDTSVTFITKQELERDHAGIPHGGSVIHSGVTGKDNKHIIEFGLRLDSNPEFTSSVLVACARAVYRFHKEGVYGCKTMFDIPLSYLSPYSDAELRKALL